MAVLASTAAARTCQNITIPVTISARNGVFGGVATPQTNLDATTFAQNSTRQGMNGTAGALTGYATVSGTYSISSTFCMPSNMTMGASNTSGSNPTVQVLTHGIGFDRSYWDLPYNGYNYSYVKTAVDDYHYCTLSYDRLGIGNSSHGEPKNEIQTFLEVQALAAITNMLRNGTIPNVKHAFQKVVHVGHSFGSAQTYELVAMYPKISDGIVLTGFSMNSSFVGFFAAGADFQQANLNQPLRFGSTTQAMALNSFLNNYGLTDVLAPVDVTALSPLNYTNGYLTNSNANSNQYLFFYPNHFDTGLLYFSEQTKQPVTIGELLTLGSVPMMNSFAGPVMVIDGSNDLPYCGGDCLATGGAMPNIASAVAKNIPNAKNFISYVQPNTGHGINAHYNSTGAYIVINQYLNANMLQSS